MCGIFAYLNFLTPRKRSEIIDVLLRGLHRMEYRGYDSAGTVVKYKKFQVFESKNWISTRKCFI